MDDSSDYIDFPSLLTEKERETYVKIRNFVNEQLDEDELNEYYDKAEFPFHVVDSIKELKLAGGTIKGYGCPGLNAVESGVIAMEIAQKDGGLATFFGILQTISMLPIYICGSEEQKQRFLPKMASLDLVGCFGLTEPNYGSDASGLQTTATPVYDIGKKTIKGYLLKGEKRWIGNGTFADITIIWARNSENGKVNGFVVEKDKVKSPEYITDAIPNKISLRSVQNAHIKMDNCFIESSNRLVNADNWATGPAKCLFLTRIIAGWIAVGLCSGAYNNALKYTKNRLQFNTPLASFQLIQEKLVRILSMIQSMKLLCWRISKLYDEDKLSFGQASMCKAFCTLNARNVLTLAREIVGGNGIVTDFGVAKAFVDIEAVYSYEGSYEINALITGREITKISAFRNKKIIKSKL
eukprot:TRINITY_DN1560_c0_g1_i1.p1 TRINITY_DN1560_c0_g1~~TRINITY_DN1560_c0_g1_i1.p1  ORF type:complete len:410 (-),score=135.19 TRINITY_DN1560_c0_g1_i1:202-1431(-)